MQRYDEYKDSGVEWIGEIPEGWEVSRISTTGIFFKGKGIPKSYLSKEGLPAIVYGDIYTKYDLKVSIVDKFIPNEDIDEFIYIKKGDLLFTGSGETKEDIGKCIVYLGEENVYIGGDIIVLRQKKLDSLFLSYVLNSKISIFQKARMAKGEIVVHIYSSNLKEILFTYPSKNEQKKIANYLNKKTTEIDELIAQKEQLLIFYEEEKAAIINQAVTKGVDSDVKMKESAVPWLGEIPEHWEVIPVKYALEIPITDGPHETPEILNVGIPFLSAEAVKNDKLDFNKKRGYISQEDHERFTMKYKPKIGDVYMVKSGATTGNLAKVETEEEFSIWSPLAALRPKKDFMITDFLFYFMKSKSFFHSVVLGWNYGTQQNIGMGVISNLKITHPPEEEQKLIVKYIIKELSIISKKIEKTKKIIALQKEYRTALISEVVTGKIKVAEES